MANDFTQTWISTPQLEKAGVDKCAIYRKTKLAAAWVWKWGQGESGRRVKLVLLSSMETRYQQRYLDWLRINEPAAPVAKNSIEPTPQEVEPSKSTLEQLQAALIRIPLDERDAWVSELHRLTAIIERYAAINPKRVKNSATGKYEFVTAVLALCAEAACTDEAIIKRESHRAQCPSPFTLDGWLRDFKKNGPLAFIRSLPKTENASSDKRDRRKAVISDAAAEWVNSHWRNFRSPTHLYKQVKKKAKSEGWTLPSKTWFFRRWKELPSLVITHHIGGAKAYVSKYAPYVPRDYSNLEALQIICGDHSERDVTVCLRDYTLARPWLTLWTDLRTGLIWGWHLDLVPSSYTAGMAYADGVMNFGAQPIARPESGFHSYVFTDQGKDYKSHHWDGNSITVHKQAMRFDGGFELLRVERQIGFLDEVGVKHLLARGYNAKEKPVERVHRDISDWEENTFQEFCGRDAKNKPDTWRDMYARHQKLARASRASESPFIGFDEYREALAGFIHEYNSTEHERITLGGARVIPLEEYRRLYTTRYEIAEETLAMLLMKAEKRQVRKNGVQCFQKHWFYYHSALAEFKGKDVEVRYTDSDYSRVWIILPNGTPCEATLITPTSIVNPNKQTLAVVAEAAARERRLIRDHSLLTFSTLRGESTEDRVTAEVELEENEVIAMQGGAPARVQKLTRMDRPKLRAVPGNRSVSVSEIAQVQTDESIFNIPDHGRVSEFDFDE